MSASKDLELLLIISREKAKDRLEGREPDQLHIAYEVELAVVRAENDQLRARLLEAGK